MEYPTREEDPTWGQKFRSERFPCEKCKGTGYARFDPADLSARTRNERMTRSESVNELAAALAKAQGEILAAKKDSENPHFRSKYADLGSVWDAIRAALTTHGLVGRPVAAAHHDNEKVWFVEVETTMFHASGQFLSDVLAVPLGVADGPRHRLRHHLRPKLRPGRLCRRRRGRR